MSKRWRLREELKREAVAGVIGVQQVASIGQQFATVLRVPVVVDRVELVEPRLGLRVREAREVGCDANLPATEIAGDVHHLSQSRAGVDAARIEQTLVWHQQATGALLGVGNG